MAFPLIGAHRGFALDAPENTIGAFVAAQAVADFAELDVRASLDGHPMIAHDPVVGGLEVATSTRASLAALDLGDGTGVPTLDEVMAAVPELALDIEIKPDVVDEGVIDRVARLARPGDWVSSFRWPTCDRVHSLGVPTGLLVDEGWDVEAALGEAVSGGHRAIVPHRRLVDADLVARARRVDVEVVVWTVDDPREARRLADYGVAAVITDRPDRIRPEANP